MNTMNNRSVVDYKKIRNLDDLNLEKSRLRLVEEHYKLQLGSGWTKLTDSINLENITDLAGRKILGDRYQDILALIKGFNNLRKSWIANIIRSFFRKQ
jgi:hypothetical protein